MWSKPKFKKLGGTRILIATAFNSTNEYNLHPNVLVKTETTAEDYYNSVEGNLYVDDYGYDNNSAEQICIRVWNMDKWSNRNIKITKITNSTKSLVVTKKKLNTSTPSPYQTESLTPLQTAVSITPPPALVTPPQGKECGCSFGIGSKRIIKSYADRIKGSRMYSTSATIKPLTPSLNIEKLKGSITTVYIETIELNGVQIPVLIGLAFGDQFTSFIIDKSVLKTDVDLAVQNLMSEFFNYIIQDAALFKIKNIFAHNLGGFDGYFIYKYLSLFSGGSANPEGVKTIIDHHNKFILIS